MIVLGVDVGLQVSGYVVCKIKRAEVKILKEGEIKTTSGQTFAEKLEYIYTELEKEARNYKPQVFAIEQLYSHYKHPTTLGLLAQVRGVVVLLAQRSGIKLFECSPTRARKAFLGQGNAKSFQVKKMAGNLTGKDMLSLHTADAFSLVVAFSHEDRLKNIEMLIQ